MADDKDELKKQAVANFLREFKQIASDQHQFILVDRGKNEAGLIDLGITLKMAKKMILQLSVEDYFSGPTPDQNRPGEVWEFGKTVLTEDAYIKLKLDVIKGQKIAKCLSFHKAERPIIYPFKD